MGRRGRTKTTFIVPEKKAGAGESFAEKMTLLFETRLSPDLDPYTLVEVSEGTGGAISPTYLMNLRDGKFSNPSMSKIKALSNFFKVPITYFYDENSAQKLREQMSKELEEAVNSLADAEARKKLVENTSDRAKALLIHIIKKSRR